MAYKTRMEIKHIPTGTEWIGTDVDYKNDTDLNELTNIVNSWAAMTTFTLIGVGNVRIALGKKIIDESTCSLFVYGKSD